MTQPSRIPPQSPCINVCRLDDTGCCVGCFRRIEEIAAWGSMTPEQQWAVVQAAELRKQSENCRG